MAPPSARDGSPAMMRPAIARFEIGCTAAEGCEVGCEAMTTIDNNLGEYDA
jgi:hypothetical protein